MKVLGVHASSEGLSETTVYKGSEYNLLELREGNKHTPPGKSVRLQHNHQMVPRRGERTLKEDRYAWLLVEQRSNI